MKQKIQYCLRGILLRCIRGTPQRFPFSVVVLSVDRLTPLHSAQSVRVHRALTQAVSSKKGIYKPCTLLQSSPENNTFFCSIALQFDTVCRAALFQHLTRALRIALRSFPYPLTRYHRPLHQGYPTICAHRSKHKQGLAYILEIQWPRFSTLRRCLPSSWQQPKRTPSSPNPNRGSDISKPSFVPVHHVWLAPTSRTGKQSIPLPSHNSGGNAGKL